MTIVDVGRDLLDKTGRSCEIEKIEMADFLKRKLADCDWRLRLCLGRTAKGLSLLRSRDEGSRLRTHNHGKDNGREPPSSFPPSSLQDSLLN